MEDIFTVCIYWNTTLKLIDPQFKKCTVGLMPQVPVTLTYNRILGWLPAAMI